MFDRTFIQPTEVRHVSKTVNVTEKRAPTDESVRLPKELEKEAFEKVVSFNVLDNDLKMSWVVMQKPSDRSKFAICQLKLNGKDHNFKVEVPVHSGYSEETVAKLVMEAVKERLAVVITMDLFKTTFTKMR